MEHTLTLADGRTLVYQEAGDPQSDTVLLYLHGLFTYGKIETKNPSPVFKDKSIHQIYPTLPGWGESTPYPPSGKPYPTLLYSDMTALLNHTRPVPPKHLYVAGGSFGTVPAQLLYGAPYSEFPYGRCIAGVMIMGPLSPFTQHKDYAKDFTWPNYLGVGPLAPYLPFLPYLTKKVMSSKFKDEKSARAFMKNMLSSKMTAEDKQEFEQWAIRKGKDEDEVIGEMVEGVMKSTEHTWAGFLGTSGQLHGDWGFKVDELDEEHTRAQVFIVAADRDDTSPPNMAIWLDQHYKNSKLKMLSGGHLAVVVHMDEVWEEFLAQVPSKE